MPNERILEKLKHLPDHPGVYLMKDKAGTIIYVGKAVSLKNRVRQYFHANQGHTPKVLAMVEHIEDFETILVDSELEALILECNLIKRHRPHYNILLRDDKHYPYVRIDMSEDFPKVEITRRVKNDKAKYYGPYIAAHSVFEVMDALKKIFPVRTCNKDIARAIERRERPCLSYQIGGCMGPCTGNVSPEAYKAMMKKVANFLAGHPEEVLQELKAQMNEASESLNFERAAILRDKIQLVERVVQRQKAIFTSMVDEDVAALAQWGGQTMVEMFFIRGGKLIGTEQFHLDNAADSGNGEIMANFLGQFYADASVVPKKIYVNAELGESARALEAWLTEKRGSMVEVVRPQRGEKLRLVKMAEGNALEILQKNLTRQQMEEEKTYGAMAALKTALVMDKLPRRIECYDISNIQGTNSVASMVVFIEGKPAKKQYRRFRIKQVEGPNDFLSMYEVINRRFTRGLKEHRELVEAGRDPREGKFSDLPDLVVIDGGKGQLGYARRAMEETGAAAIFTVGLAKRFEEIILPDRDDPVILDKASPALKLMQRIRDEAHRFAITYHRSLRTKSGLMSVLDEVPGIGPKKRTLLMNHYGTLRAIQQATLEELYQVPGLGKPAAENVYHYFHEGME